MTRLWAKDVTLWPGEPAHLANQLDWLEAPAWMSAHGAKLQQWARAVVQSGDFSRVVVLGMGGSSLSAQVFYSVFGPAAGYLPCCLLDTTNPAQIATIADESLLDTLFIVASKSGTTIETIALGDYFFQRVRACRSARLAGQHFIAITDPVSPLVARATTHGFRDIFYNPPKLGGRYAALSYFGLVPAALMGIDLNTLGARTRDFCQTARTGAARGQILRLAAQMANHAIGANLLRVDFAEPFRALGLWLEQLIAESIGKQGQGLVPLCGDGAWATAAGSLVVTVHADDDDANDPAATTTGAPPEFEWSIPDRYQLGGEMMRWQLATALAAHHLAVNPFDQPAVEQTKQYTRQLLAQPSPAPASPSLHLPYCTVESPQWGAPPATLATAMADFRTADTAKYLAIMAYLPMFPAVHAAVQAVAQWFADAWSLAVTIGFGPRYLHSTGQMHKDGPAPVSFLQFIESPATSATASLPIPDRAYDFAQLHRAQADSDYAVLARRAMPLVRIELKGDRIHALNHLVIALGETTVDYPAHQE